MTEVDFHFDVMCPWAYQTSKWIREVTRQRDVTVRWRFFSLEEINREEGKKHPWERPWSYGWSMLRVAALIRRGPNGDENTAGNEAVGNEAAGNEAVGNEAVGNEAVGRFYAAAGRSLHEEGIKVHTPEGVAGVLAEIDLDPCLLDAAMADQTTHEDVRADHDRVVALGGFGVPTLVLDGVTPLYGPVVTPAPTGPAAGRLWDAVAAWSEFPHLYELRRPKTQADWVHIAGSFAPYISARDWRTIERPVS